MKALNIAPSLLAADLTLIESMPPKITRLRQMANAQNPELDIKVDDGVEIHTAPRCVQAGANILIAGTSMLDSARALRNISPRCGAAAEHKKTA